MTAKKHPKSITEGTMVKATDEEVLHGLNCLALKSGNSRQAEILSGIPATTLRRWRDTFPDAYLEAQEEAAPHLRQASRELTNEAMLKAHDVEMKALVEIEKRIDEKKFDGRELAGVLHAASKSKGVNMTHMTKMMGEAPKNAGENDSVQEFTALLSALTRAGVIKVPNEEPALEGTAEEP